jgi:hypothetical protein
VTLPPESPDLDDFWAGTGTSPTPPPKSNVHARPARPDVTETEYLVRDASGEHVATCVRYDYSDGREKTFKWRRPDGTWGLDGYMTLKDMPLYGIEKLGDWRGGYMVLAEGGKATEALWEAGIPALGIMTGAGGTPGPRPLSELGGQRTILWADNDPDGIGQKPGRQGQKLMERVTTGLRGIAASVSYVNWKEAPPKGDAADLLASGGAEAVRRVVEAATERMPWAPPEHEVEPEAEAVHQSLGDYLDDLLGFVTRYVAFPSEHEPVALALWIAHSYLIEQLDASPILATMSVEPRSGKTRVLDCLALLVPNPRRMIGPSEAVFYTVLARRPRPIVLFDEIDTVFGKHPSERTEGIRAVFNSGNRRGTPVLRVSFEGKRRVVEEFDVFGPKAVAGIGSLPSTVADRSIILRLKRRAPHEHVAKFRINRATAEAHAIVLPDWSAVTLVPDVPDVPDGLDDRAADGWEPLLAIADVAGGSWPASARAAAIALSAAGDAPSSVGIRLLSDTRDVFGAAAHLATGELLRRLYELEDAPWNEWYGKPISARELAKLLHPYRVDTKQRRVNGEVVRGYFAQDFADAWKRYVVTPVGTDGTSGTSGTSDDAHDPVSATDQDAGTDDSEKLPGDDAVERGAPPRTSVEASDSDGVNGATSAFDPTTKDVVRVDDDQQIFDWLNGLPNSTDPRDPGQWGSTG